MKRILDRDRYDSRAREWRRLILVTVALAVLGGAWHLFRPRAIHWAACRSIGWPGRTKLLQAALHEELTRTARTGQGRTRLLCRAAPAPGWVSWIEPTRFKARPPPAYTPQFHFVDHKLRYKGRLKWWPGRCTTPPGDMDGDGRWEVLLQCSPPRGTALSPGKYTWHALIRLGTERNEIVWAGRASRHLPGSPDVQIVPIRRDEDGDGIDELVYVTREGLKWPKRGYAPPEIVAVFEWNAPGGTLRPRLLPEDGSVVACPLPESTPIPVDRNANLRPIVASLLTKSDEAYNPKAELRSIPRPDPNDRNR